MLNEIHTTAGVAAGHQETAKAAVEILDAGGNAFDAAIAGFLAACVAEPVLASLGGGGFLMAHSPDGHSKIFDFFTQTPGMPASRDDVDFHAIVADFGTAQQEFHIGLGAVATPGAIAGIFAVHDKLGQLPMTEIVKPAVRLAKSGLTINDFQAYLLTVVEPIYLETSEARAQFCKMPITDGEAHIKASGDVLEFPELADFLETLAIEGADLFYKGEVADQIDQYAGCTITKSDLARYQVVERDPVNSVLRDYRVSINPPPAIGGALITLALSMLDERVTNSATFGSVAYARTLVSVMDACNQARVKSGIDVNPIRGAEILKHAVSHPPSYRGTTHISVADDEGHVAALTVSNGEGCGSIIPGTGIMLNNMLGEEDLNAAGFFNWPLDTRMSSMMSPGVIVSPKGEVTGFGSGGSNRIRSAITQFIANLSIFEMDLVAAVKSPRLHLEGGKLDIEPGFGDGTLHALAAEYESAKVWPSSNMFFGGVHAIQRRSDGFVAGAADHRRGGVFIPL
jgi:gamma-glutamyltranspeptidase/glutathione hydrolase